MKKFLVGLILLGTSLLSFADIVTVPIPGAPGLSVTVGTGANALPLQNINTNPNAVNITTGDDSWNNVPLGFDFPFYGKTFTNSWAMTNGVVTFQDPMQSGAYGLCCSGVDLSRNPGSQYNYSIYGLHTDLYSWNGNNQYYLRGTNEMTYGWYNISQCCSSQGGNSFEIKINSAGVVDTRIGGTMLQYNAVTSGMAGDLSKGEYYQYYHGDGANFPRNSSWAALSGTGNGADLCLVNPLSDPSCPGYAAAYLSQQCNINSLYNTSCPGYAASYLLQQCNTNSLYSTTCSGYTTSINQCNLDPLSNSLCPFYQTAVTECGSNPMYGSYCPGYTTASLECGVNPFSHTYCPMYSSATASCSANALTYSYCPGYTTAQTACTTNPLSNTLCSNYQSASASCTANQLTYSYCPMYQSTLNTCTTDPLSNNMCPGYQFAYDCQQDGLYSKQCPNYAEAYAKKNILNISTTPTTVAVVETTATVATTTTAPTSESITTQLSSGIADTTVSNVVAVKTSSATTETNPVAAVKLTAPAGATTTTVTTAAASEKKEEAKKEEVKKNETSTTTTTASTETKPNDQPKSNREALVEKRREAAVKEAVAKGANLANEMGKAADMEAQKAVQNVVIQAMGFTPGFDTYNKAMLPDSRFYKPYQVYGNQVNVDNRTISRRLMGGSDRTHQEMIDSQYKGEKNDSRD